MWLQHAKRLCFTMLFALNNGLSSNRKLKRLSQWRRRPGNMNPCLLILIQRDWYLHSNSYRGCIFELQIWMTTGVIDQSISTFGSWAICAKVLVPHTAMGCSYYNSKLHIHICTCACFYIMDPHYRYATGCYLYCERFSSVYVCRINID